MKINFHRVLLGFFENWDKSPQKKWDKGAVLAQLPDGRKYGKLHAIFFRVEKDEANDPGQSITGQSGLIEK